MASNRFVFTTIWFIALFTSADSLVANNSNCQYDLRKIPGSIPIIKKLIYNPSHYPIIKWGYTDYQGKRVMSFRGYNKKALARKGITLRNPLLKRGDSIIKINNCSADGIIKSISEIKGPDDILQRKVLSTLIIISLFPEHARKVGFSVTVVRDGKVVSL